MKKIYLASPYTHEDPKVMEARFRAVCIAAGELMLRGNIVYCPIAMTHPIALYHNLPKGWGFWKKQDLPFVRWCDEFHVLVLRGWSISEGVCAEMADAKKLRKPVLFIKPKLDPLDPALESVCAEADRLSGDRQPDYGHPIEDFTRTGKLWAAILGLEKVTPQQVGLCMAAVKISRECHKPKRDNRVDACGYMKTVDMIEEKLSEP